MSGGVLAEKDVPLRDVIKYDIKRGKWSTCPPLLFANVNHSSCCLDGKLYLFFGQVKGKIKKMDTMIS